MQTPSLHSPANEQGRSAVDSAASRATRDEASRMDPSREEIPPSPFWVVPSLASQPNTHTIPRFKIRNMELFFFIAIPRYDKHANVVHIFGESLRMKRKGEFGDSGFRGPQRCRKNPLRWGLKVNDRGTLTR